MLAELRETVILDAKYDRVAERHAVLARAQRAGILVAILSCEAPLEVLQERLHQRSGRCFWCNCGFIGGAVCCCGGVYG